MTKLRKEFVMNIGMEIHREIASFSQRPAANFRIKSLNILQIKCFYENGCPSHDGSGKPFEIKLIFFLDKKSAQRKLLFVLGKNNFMKKLEAYSRI